MLLHSSTWAARFFALTWVLKLQFGNTIGVSTPWFSPFPLLNCKHMESAHRGLPRVHHPTSSNPGLRGSFPCAVSQPSLNKGYCKIAQWLSLEHTPVVAVLALSRVIPFFIFPVWVISSCRIPITQCRIAALNNFCKLFPTCRLQFDFIVSKLLSCIVILCLEVILAHGSLSLITLWMLPSAAHVWHLLKLRMVTWHACPA